MYYFFSPNEKYTEVPINLIIKKDILISIADYHYIADKNQLIDKKHNINYKGIETGITNRE